MKITYRPEIDGLRAIAVGSVIIYHSKINIYGTKLLLGGGFIGVDIFFVISGYLISSIIFKELAITGSFSIKYFYERRIRRILPALLFVMLVSLPFAWIYLLPSSFIDFSKSILYSLGFSSNYYFYYTGLQYSAVDGLLKPFLHTWSLSVEEQFYILFPIVLLVIFKYFRKYLIHIFILGFVISLGLAEWTSRNYPSASFYFLHTRMWELLAGSILAYFKIIKSHQNQNYKFSYIMPSFGLILILCSLFYFNDQMYHPSFLTLIPVLGTSMIIMFSEPRGIITKILSMKLFVSIGLISYSLYLWHYPIFAFMRISEFAQGNLFKKIIVGLIILALSIVTYYLIEKPFRDKRKNFKNLFIIIIFSISFLSILNLIIIKNDGFKKRLPAILNQHSTIPLSLLLKNNKDEVCFDNIKGCKFNTASSKKIFIIGDSHVGSIFFDLKDKIINKGYQFVTSVLNSCLYFPGFDSIDARTNKKHKLCNDNYFQTLKQTLLIEKNSIIIIGGRFPVYLSNLKFDNKEGGIEGKVWENNRFDSVSDYNNITESFKSEVLELSKNNKIILIYPIPEVGWDINKKIWIERNNKFTNNFNLKYITTSYQVYKQRNQSSFELLDSLEGENIYRVYPHKLFCNTKIKNRCLAHDDKNIFYSDDNHPSLKGAKMINELIMKEIKKIELKSN